MVTLIALLFVLKCIVPVYVILGIVLAVLCARGKL